MRRAAAHGGAQRRQRRGSPAASQKGPSRARHFAPLFTFRPILATTGAVVARIGHERSGFMQARLQRVRAPPLMSNPLDFQAMAPSQTTWTRHRSAPLRGAHGRNFIFKPAAAGSDFSSIHGPSGASKKSNLEIFILPLRPLHRPLRPLRPLRTYPPTIHRPLPCRAAKT